jgi:hypothetical protein
MTQNQDIALKSAFKSIVSLAYSGIDDENKTSCCVFNIKPFNTNWDKKTVEEVMEGIHRYVRTWILHPLEENFDLLDTLTVKDDMLLSWHQKQIDIIQSRIRKQK